MQISTDFFEDHANNLSTSFNYSFIDAYKEVVKTLEPSEGDFDIMVKLAGEGFTSGEMEHISSDEKSYRLVWTIKEHIGLNINLFFSILFVSLAIIICYFNFIEVSFFTIFVSLFLFLFIFCKSLELFLNFSIQIHTNTNKKLELLKEQRDAIALNKLS